jgi:2-oxoisovalerate dehydrogenase E1 component
MFRWLKSINNVLNPSKKKPLIRMFGEDVADFTDLTKLRSNLKGKGGVFAVPKESKSFA